MGFYKDKNNINVIQFGSGDVLVSEATFDNKSIVGVIFAQTQNGEIGRDVKEAFGKKDFELNTKLKFIFTDTKSIDVVIKQLKEAKQILTKAEQNHE